jgi:hypothetical protein
LEYRVFSGFTEEVGPTFDVSHEKMDSIPIWVHFPGLSLKFWFVKCFQAIGNFLGDYISVDLSFKETGVMFLAHILVSLNVRGGLQKQFKMTNMGHTCTQILDYEGVPFRYRRFHEYGHILKDFSLPFRDRT